jgi:D-3-phosphoglycerate dehydrogenase / 2-oxoglutarate reductase
VIAFDPYLTREAAERLGVESVELDDLLARSDFITIHTPLTGDTRHLLGDAELARTKPGVRLINCARGGIIEEQALVRALQSGHVAGAALDVFEQEPPPAGHSLFALPNVIMAPHVAGVTREAVDRMSEQTARNILSALDGQPIRQNVINPDVLG